MNQDTDKDSASPRGDAAVPNHDTATDVNGKKAANPYAARDTVLVDVGGTKKVPPRPAPKPSRSQQQPRASDMQRAQPHTVPVQSGDTVPVQSGDTADYMRIKDRTKLAMRRDQDLFVETSAYKAALEELQQAGFVLLTGPPGTGKSMAAYALLRHYQAEGFTPLILQKYEELQFHVGGEKKIAVLLEDVLESSSLHDNNRFSTFKPQGSSLEVWLRILPAMQRAARCSSRVILATTNDANLQRHRSDENFSHVADKAMNLAYPRYTLTTEEKKLILEKHLQRARMTVPEETVDETLKISNNVNGCLFLSQCKLFSESTLPEKERLQIFTEEPNPQTTSITDSSQPQNQTVPDISSKEPQPSDKNNLQSLNTEEPLFPKKEDPKPSDLDDPQPMNKQLVLKISPELTKKSITTPLRNVGMKGVVFQGLTDINKIINDSNWTTEGVEHILPKFKAGVVSPVDTCTGEMTSEDNGTARGEADVSMMAAADSLSKLQQACKTNDKDTVQTLVKLGIDLTARDVYGFTALHVASLAGHLEITKLLLDHKCPVDATDNRGWTALHLTCLSGQSDTAELLIENGASMEQETAVGIRPLHIACRYGHVATVQVLLEKGAEGEARQSKGCMAHPLHLAALCGHVNVMEVLIKHRAKVDVEDLWGWLPLHFACQEGYVDAVKQLIDASAQPLHIETVAVDCPNDHTRLLKKLILCKVCSHDSDSTIVCESCYDTHIFALENLSLHASSADKPAKDGVTGLYLAAQNGHSDVVETLLKTGACAEALREGLTSPADGFTALHAACHNGHVHVVDLLIRYETFLDSSPSDVLLTPLHLASMQGHKNVVDTLLQHGASPDLRDNRGLSPLHLACINGHNHLLPCLLAVVKDVYSQAKAGSELLTFTCKYGTADILKTLVNWIPSIIENALESFAVHAASSEGKVDVLTILLEHNLSPNTQVYGSGPIHMAAERGHAQAVHTLLKYGASVNNVNSNSNTPLHLACNENHPDVVRVLLGERSADIEARDRNGRTALHMAAGADSSDIVKLLLSVGADANAQDSDYKTPLYETASLDVVNVLLRSRADVNIPTSRGDTPLHRMCHLGLEQIVEALLAAKANSTTRDNSGQTPLLKACQSKNNASAIARMLLDKIGGINMADFQGRTPIHEACRQGDADLLKLLLEHNGDVKKVDDAGDTALHKACISGNVDVIVTLINAGAAINQRNIDGDTPLHHACANLHPDIVKLLLDMGAVKSLKNKTGLSAMDVVRSMALIPPLPPDFLENDHVDEELQREQNFNKLRMDRRKEVLGHFVDSSPSSARSSMNLESHNNTSTPASHTDNYEKSKKPPVTINDCPLPNLPTKDYVRRSLVKSDTTSSQNSASKPFNSGSDWSPQAASKQVTLHTETNGKENEGSKPEYPNDNKDSTEMKSQPLAVIDGGKSAEGTNLNAFKNRELKNQINTFPNTGTDADEDTRTRTEDTHEVGDMGSLEDVFDVPDARDLSSQFTDEDLITRSNAAHDEATVNTRLSSLAINDIPPTLPKTVETRTRSPAQDTPVITEHSTESAESPSLERTRLEATLAFLDSGHLMHAACLRGDAHAVMQQLSTADINARSPPDDRTPLHYACAGGHNHIAAVILRLGADTEVKDARGQGPLHLACSAGHLHTVHLLLTQGGPGGTDLEQRDRNGNSPLLLAAQMGRVTITSLLLTLGADVTSADWHGRTALHAAGAEGHTAVVAVLLAHGAPSSALDQHGDTPLTLAAEGGHADCCLLMLAAGADPHAKNARGESAHSLAAASRDPLFQAVLSRHGAGRLAAKRPFISL